MFEPPQTPQTSLITAVDPFLTLDVLNTLIEPAALSNAELTALVEVLTTQVIDLTEKVNELTRWGLWLPSDRDHLETSHAIE